MESKQTGSDKKHSRRIKEKVIEAHNVTKNYVIGKNIIVRALRGASVEIRKGDFVFIVGPSGSGKSTLMHLLGALDHPTKGTVKLNNRKIGELDDWQLSLIRRNKVGFIFQTFNLIPSLNCIDNVILPLMTDKHVKEEELKARAINLLKKVGLGHRLYHTPNELSGGERQRVAIARALINNPAIVLADEPTGNLDSKIGDEIFKMMRKMNQEEGTTFIVVTHDTEYIRPKDKVFHLKDGVITESYRNISNEDRKRIGTRGKKR